LYILSRCGRRVPSRAQQTQSIAEVPYQDDPPDRDPLLRREEAVASKKRESKSEKKRKKLEKKLRKIEERLKKNPKPSKTAGASAPKQAKRPVPKVKAASKKTARKAKKPKRTARSSQETLPAEVFTASNMAAGDE
jgi:hypothetical protein